MSDDTTTVDTNEQAEDQATSRQMVLISLEQRGALLEYLGKQPYQDVAGGIEFLRNAIPINVNFTNEPAADAAEAPAG